MRTSFRVIRTAVGLGGVVAGLLSLCALTWCSNSPSGTMADMGVIKSCCSNAGTPGNSLGVGKFCTAQTDCDKGSKGTVTTLCSAIYEPQRNAYFCTLPCFLDGGTSQCGEGATCTPDSTQPGLSGCVPTTCITNLPAGCTL